MKRVEYMVHVFGEPYSVSIGKHTEESHAIKWVRVWLNLSEDEFEVYIK